MITNNEIKAVQLSATKKDYYQIWNELLELAGKISERWDPTSTNESDPGIVLLKVLTALGDKLNYSIDSNILEAFMPSAAQAESMRKLCEMLGYNMKYFGSATTKVTISYIGAADLKNSLVVPMFTSLTNIDNDINYITTESKIISNSFSTQTINCMEGQIVQCESENNNIITINQLDDNNRYFLPEYQIAENGIFIYRISDGIKSERWKQVQNLNTQSFNSLVYKFGFDSQENRPYVQFPEDIGQIIEDGLEIYFVRTSGVNGNISANTISTFEKPNERGWDTVEVDDFTVTNNSAATNGHDLETITQAYDNYKRQVGLLDTLVTCRDYMNVIYNLTDDLDRYIISNDIVTDIRSDINKAITLCSFDNFGIKYVSSPLKEEITMDVEASDKLHKGEKFQIKSSKDLISNFDLVLYPFKAVYDLNNKQEYTDSFKLDTGEITRYQIESQINNIKNIAHNISYPGAKDIVCIKNYLKLDAKIATTTKVNYIEEQSIIESIKKAIFTEFNARHLEFGQEIPFDQILDCIEYSDVRIKNVALEEPILYTRFELADGTEVDNASFEVAIKDDDTYELSYLGRELYNKLALRNILAGKLAIFNYNNWFSTDLNEAAYPGLENMVFPELDKPNKKLIKIEPSCKLLTAVSSVTEQEKTVAALPALELSANELVKFRMPNFKTKKTYPAYVNYYLHLDGSIESQDAIPAQFRTLKEFLADDQPNYLGWVDDDIVPNKKGWHAVLKELKQVDGCFKNNQLISCGTNITQEQFNQNLANFGALFIKHADIVDEVVLPPAVFDSSKSNNYYYLTVTESTFLSWHNFITTRFITNEKGNSANESGKHYLGLFRSLGYILTRPIGYLVDINHNKYQSCGRWKAIDKNSALTYFYIQVTYDKTVEPSSGSNGYTADGLGLDAVYKGIPKNAEYVLKPGEYLAINYTPSAPQDQPDADVEPKNELLIAGDIIRPNFELKDSNSLAENNIRYSKTSGYSFKGKSSDIKEELPGMYSLGPNEQIEVRDFVEVKLDSEDTYLYWITKESNPVKKDATSYILQDGEYLFYTDEKKTSMAYYGSGSEIILNNINIFTTTVSNKNISIETIMEKGLDVIPWIRFSFNENDKNIAIREYQYITLAEGDLINKIVVTAPTSSYFEIDENWQQIEGANYVLGGKEQKLPKISITGISWEVRSVLTVNLSPTHAQELIKEKLAGTVDSNRKLDMLKLVYQDASLNEETTFLLQPSGDDSLSVKSNYICQATTDVIDTKITKIGKSGKKEDINDFKLKAYKNSPIGAVVTYSAGKNKTEQVFEGSKLNLHNFNNLWTSVNLKSLNSPDDYIQLNLNTLNKKSEKEEDHKFFGLLMINYDVEESTAADAYLTAETDEISKTPVPLTIFNLKDADGNEIWWTPVEDNKYILRKGINIIKIRESCILKIHPDEKLNATVIFGDLSLVDKEHPINSSLIDYQNTAKDRFKKVNISGTAKPNANDLYLGVAKQNDSKDSGEKYKLIKGKDLNGEFLISYDWYSYDSSVNVATLDNRILQDINYLDTDHQFYYNCPIDNSQALNLNAKLLGTEDEERLSTPRIYYDANNENNNFVISEIDADYLDYGLDVTRSSKRY